MNELCKLCKQHDIHIEFTGNLVILKKFYFEGEDLKVFRKGYYITENIEEVVDLFINEYLKRSI